MKVSIIIDRDYFLVTINGSPAKTGREVYNEVSYGDVIQISSNCRRDWYVQGTHIGLHDREYDVLYPAVYTVVPEEAGTFSCEIKAELTDSNTGIYGDVFPYSACPVKISSPWFFLGTDMTMRKVRPETFDEKVILYRLGEMIATATSNDLSFKVLSAPEDYSEYPKTCGILKGDDGYIWIINKSADKNLPSIKKKEFESLSEVKTYIFNKYMKEVSDEQD